MHGKTCSPSAEIQLSKVQSQNFEASFPKTDNGLTHFPQTAHIFESA